MSPLLFWDLSVGEVVDVIDAKSKKEKERLKFDVTTKQVQAMQISEYVSTLIDKGNAEKITPIWDFYPSLFKDEKKTNENLKENMELDNFKSRRRMFALNHNKIVGGDGD